MLRSIHSEVKPGSSQLIVDGPSLVDAGSNVGTTSSKRARTTARPIVQTRCARRPGLFWHIINGVIFLFEMIPIEHVYGVCYTYWLLLSLSLSSSSLQPPLFLFHFPLFLLSHPHSLLSFSIASSFASAFSRSSHNLGEEVRGLLSGGVSHPSTDLVQLDKLPAQLVAQDAPLPASSGCRREPLEGLCTCP